jgi:hypothetical protein
MTDKPVNLDQHRGMVAEKATPFRLLADAEARSITKTCR